MHCKQCRIELHNWFDSYGRSVMPEDVSAHVQRCQDCLMLVQQWNSVELGMQAIRNSAPSPSASFTHSLGDRIARGTQTQSRRFNFNFPPRLVVVCSLVVIVGLLLFGKLAGVSYNGVQIFGMGSNSNMANTEVTGRPADSAHSSDFAR